MSGKKGFTLSEIMVVVVLLSVVSGAVFSFYSIGLRTHKIARDRSESVAAVRFMQKLLERKATVKSADNYSTFMKKFGMEELSPILNEIMKAPLNGKCLKLYEALGFNAYEYSSVSKIEISTVGVIINRFKEFGMENYDTRMLIGPRICEISKEVELERPDDGIYRFCFGMKPAKIWAYCPLPPPPPIVLKCTVAGSSDTSATHTAEINTGRIVDFTDRLTDHPRPYFWINFSEYPVSSGKLFNIIASFEDKIFMPPSDTFGMTESSFKHYFMIPSNIFCDDGMMIYDVDTSGVVTNHAFYVTTPGPENYEVEFDDDGMPLKQVRYCMSRFKGDKLEPGNPIDDVVISNVKKIKFNYYDKNYDQITCPQTDWKWHPGDEVSSVTVDLITSYGGSSNSSRISVDFETF